MNYKDKSIHKGIIHLFVGIILLVSLIYSILLLGYSWIVEDNIFNRIVTEEANYIEKIYKEERKLVDPRAPFLTLYPGWDELPVDIYLQHLKDVNQVEFKSGDRISLYVHPLEIEGENAVLVADITKYEVGRDYLPVVSMALLALLAVVAALASYMAYYLAKKTLKPLERLTNKIASNPSIDDGFSDEFPKNEIGMLAETIELSFKKTQELLSREENFTRDVSHELRTPTTVIKNVIAELKQNDTLSAKQLNYLEDNTLRIEQIINTLLALARNEATLLEPIRFIDVLEDVVVSHFELSKHEDFTLQMDVSESLQVSGNKNLLQLLINNLISNAIHYSSDHRLKIYSDEGAVIIFENETDYIHKDNPISPKVKRESSQGLGLGLFLVERVCLALNWEVDVEVSSGQFRIIINTSPQS
ncbi:HAMP domain-containing sensor histidine kinase [uncultured Pseudoteredinibacter sp.]|uniref:sensor histidine kinase n=1 Tax=uncultured Pseudoteredinibacter sp. TaxID=1641701 RepID=UPI0026051F22|nr:HAMP domain-containing sensor histidine kinase [uncultured Pseudoteredinibacter sp.]